jgi:hypothetical protein
VADSVHAMTALLVQGRIGGCIACHGSSVWWLPDGFTDGASVCVHPRCVPTFYAMEEFDDAPSVGPVKPMGAYAAMGAPVAVESAVPLRRTLEWAYDDPRRWMVRVEGVVTSWATPFGSDIHAVALYERMRLLAERGLSANPHWHNQIVGVALLGPEGGVMGSWIADKGCWFEDGKERWPSLSRRGVFTTCSACRAVRWPSCWMDGRDRCLDCVRADDPADDPRPYWPDDPNPPPESVWPEHLRSAYKPKRLGLPKGMRGH